MTISRRFSVITTLPRSVAIIEDLVTAYGAERHCRKVRAIDLPVLALEEERERAEQLLILEIKRAGMRMAPKPSCSAVPACRRYARALSTQPVFQSLTV